MIKLPRDPWKALLAALLLALVTGNGVSLFTRETTPPPCSDLTERVTRMEENLSHVVKTVDRFSDRLDAVLLSLSERP
jgi:hypothetical protein